MKKVIVTGAAGYLGQVLCPLLIKNNFEVVGYDNFLYQQSEPDFPIIRGSVTDIKSLYAAIDGADFVVHLAAIVGDPACNLNAEETKSINYLATKYLVEVCKEKKVKKLVFASTCSVYGKNDKIVNEKSETNPLSLYAETKLDSEKEIISSGIKAAILRFGTLFGASPRMRFDLVLNQMTASAVQDGVINLCGGDQKRPMVAVQDAANAILQMLIVDDATGVFNVVGENVSISKIASLAEDLTAAKINKTEGTDKRDYSADCERLIYKTFFEPKITLTDGISQIIFLFNSGLIHDFKHKKYHNEKIIRALQL